jgi:hypothetical protein
MNNIDMEKVLISNKVLFILRLYNNVFVNDVNNNNNTHLLDLKITRKILKATTWIVDINNFNDINSLEIIYIFFSKLATKLIKIARKNELDMSGIEDDENYVHMYDTTSDYDDYE